MSLIYATKIEGKVTVFADTKISFSPMGTKPLWSDETQNLVRQFGIIKNIIIGEHLCVSFAGNNLVLVNELLCKIKHITVEELLRIAFEIHNRNVYDGIDFIICFSDEDKQAIYEIKGGKCSSVETTWIGSYDAFKYLQGVRTGEIGNRIIINNPMATEFTAGTGSSPFDIQYQKLFDAFFKTVYDCGDSTVGGFVVPVIYDAKANTFIYKGYLKSFGIKEMKKGIFRYPLYQRADKGAYSILFYHSRSCVGLYLPQAYLGIFYNHHRVNPLDIDNTGTAALFIPQATRMHQIDFYIQVESQGLTPPGFLGCDPDNIDEIFKRIETYKNDPSMALLYINKIIEIIKMQRRDLERLDLFQSIKENIKSSLMQSSNR